MITVFTPTYNRAHLLSRVFDSLKKQTHHHFEWIIVDDGSEDDTKEVVQNFIKENTPFKIHYYHQKNQGKHIAINHAITKANGEYLLVCDSDDYLEPQCIETVYQLISKIKDKQDFSGVAYIRYSDKINYDERKYNNKVWEGTTTPYYDWEFHGEFQIVYKTSILKKFMFPVFSGEKFCRESLIHRRLRRAGYQVLYSNYVLAHGDYLEEGLTQNFNKALYGSPRYSLLYIKEMIIDEKNTKAKLQLAKQYYNLIRQHKKYWYKLLELPFSLHLKMIISRFKR
ncbi:glycosyltransferase family 2 protein [Riemerella columbina]|uniref:glycosyltransferase family 2 protein n=1 Tax=Riemerella columbina TaxID=103810 RepID=UPI00266F0A69|nr:glycosyltransferase family 2 protein [Riemerella columbina]WKS95147.1 glycosyltransferase family 2 protein [Riemerella columbina]